MTRMSDQTLYIFIDESGDFNFSSSGSKYFFLTATSTLTPENNRDKLRSLKYELLKSGTDLEYFHATEDKQATRDKVFDIIKSFDDIEIDCIVAEKRKANRSLYQTITLDSSGKGTFKLKKTSVEEVFYQQVCHTLLKYLLTRYSRGKHGPSINKIVVTLDQALTNNKRGFVIKKIKAFVKETFDVVPYVYFHSMKADVNCQISDYCSWAIAVKWNRGETRPYDLIKTNIKNEFDIFRKGVTEFY